MLWRLAFIVALLLSCARDAQAAPAIVAGSAATCSTTSACTLGVSPTNGDIVFVVVPNTAAVGSVTVKDSNSVSLTEHQPAGNCVAANALCVAIFDYLVTGGPTNSYTIAGVTANDTNCAAYAEIGEVSGAVYGSALYASSNASTYSTPLVNTLSGVRINDFQMSNTFCNASSGGITTTISNGSNVNIATQQWRYALATSTASSTSTVSFGTSATSVVTTYIDYPALASVIVGPTCGIFPWPCIFQPN